MIASCLNGDSCAWDMLLGRYKALIYSIALRMSLSEADAADVFQQVCLTMLDHLGDLRDHSRLAGWIASATKREAWRVGRQRSTTLTSELSESAGEAILSAEASDGQSPEAALLAIERQQVVFEAMQQLPERCRLLLSLFYATENPCSYAEAAARLNMAVNSVGANRVRCLQHLRKILAESGF